MTIPAMAGLKPAPTKWWIKRREYDYTSNGWIKTKVVNAFVKVVHK